MRYGWEYTRTLYCLESHSVFKGGQTYIVSSEDDISYFVMIDGKEHSVNRDTEMFEVDEILNSEVQHD